MINFYAFQGIVTAINDFNTGQSGEGCFKVFSVENQSGTTVNFIVSPSTYFVDYAMVSAGDLVTGYYDGNAPVPLIYPPQYQALVVVRESQNQNVKVSYFNNQLVSSDGQLKLNLSPFTQTLLTNGQAFTGNPANRDLVVIYGASTKSIPAQTVPYRVIVLCS
ncbi:hypothetical protein M4D55_23565 [Metabacillus idriensis]|uniref:hypothetical protein n=1 Tax=Metabacillus idriensis TaxID=324768 RepID=UPI0008A8466A|nr:hypothetical protein [Metabacillus idriensis]MCM3598742.1 hypothetical protein [Metabacillus idriensis]OHR74446.1 hypothetical protein HMPREF3291_04050 [Bacillus sp. HMSC76G11]